MKIKFFISDVDGTLVDRMSLYAETFAKLVKPFGINVQVAQKYFQESTVGPLEEEFSEILSLHNLTISSPEIEGLCGEFFKLVEKKEVALFPGVGETLAELKRRNISLCATSGSRTKPLEELFAKKELPFDAILGSDGYYKKGDEHIAFFAKFFGVNRLEFCRSALYVGDARADMRFARKNGIFAVGITNTISAELLRGAGADEIITSFPEILNLIS